MRDVHVACGLVDGWIAITVGQANRSDDHVGRPVDNVQLAWRTADDVDLVHERVDGYPASLGCCGDHGIALWRRG